MKKKGARAIPDFSRTATRPKTSGPAAPATDRASMARIPPISPPRWPPIEMLETTNEKTMFMIRIQMIAAATVRRGAASAPCSRSWLPIMWKISLIAV